MQIQRVWHTRTTAVRLCTRGADAGVTRSMKKITMIGVALIVLGAVALCIRASARAARPCWISDPRDRIDENVTPAGARDGAAGGIVCARGEPRR